MRRRTVLLAALALAAMVAGLGVDTGKAASQAKVVRLPLPQYDGTLTPFSFELAYPLVTLVYDTLMWRDAQGVPQPWLAQSVSRTNGGRSYTIRLRKGVRWHDGRPLTSADVAFTFDFVKRRFHPRFTPQLSDVESVAVVDARTVRIGLRQPSIGFLDQPLADLPILPRHLWQGLSPGAVPAGRPVGSGPYRLTAISRKRGYVFTANRRYFKGPPRVDRIRVPIIRQEARTYAALQARKVDMLPVPLPESATKRLGGAFGINIKRGPSYSGTALLLNVRRPPFDRPATRRAVAQALDLGRIVDNVGIGAAAEQGYVHPESAWSPRTPLHRLDLAAARRVFEAANLPTIRVLAPDNDPVRLEAGRQVALALKRAGAKAELLKVSRPALGAAIGEDGSPADFDAAITSTPPLASYDPDFLRRVFGSNPREAPLNYSGYRSPAFEQLADRVASAPTRRARRSAVTAELRLLAKDAPAIPLFFSEGRFAYRPAIHDGWVFIKGSGIFDKRSFLAGATSSTPPPVSDGDEGSTDSSTSFLDVLQIVSLVILAVVLLLGGWAIVQRRRAGP
jgi:peptide/nickel transport system substrate-binding protein